MLIEIKVRRSHSNISLSDWPHDTSTMWLTATATWNASAPPKSESHETPSTEPLLCLYFLLKPRGDSSASCLTSPQLRKEAAAQSIEKSRSTSVKDWNVSVFNGMSRHAQVPVCHDRLCEGLYDDNHFVRYRELSVSLDFSFTSAAINSHSRKV